MGLSYKGSIDFANSFNVTATRPLDVRLVVDSVEDLYKVGDDRVIQAPYKGMVVSILGTSNLYVYVKEGLDAVADPDAWSKVSGVEVVDDLTQDTIDGLVNPEEGLIINIRNTDKLYILVKPDDWMYSDEYYQYGDKKGEKIPWNRRRKNYLRIGGITEEHAYQILTPEQHDAAVACVHNRFTNTDFYILLDPKKSQDGFNDPHPHVEMVTTEMLDDALDQVYETIDNVKKELDNNIEYVDKKLNSRIDDVSNDLNNSIDETNDYIDSESERLDGKIDELSKNLNDKIDTNNNIINDRINSVEEDLKKDIEDVDDYYNGEVDRLDEKIDNQNKNLSDKIDETKDELNQKIDISKSETNQSIENAYDYFDGQSSDVENELRNVESNLNNKIDTNDDNINKHVDRVENDLTNQISDVDDYYNGEVDRLDDRITNQDSNFNNKLDNTHDELNKKIESTKSELKEDIENVYDNYDDEVNRLDEKIDNQGKSLSDRIDTNDDNINKRVDKVERDFNDQISDVYDNYDDEVNRLDDRITNQDKNLNQKIEENNDNLNKRIDDVQKDFSNQIEDLDGYIDSEIDRIENKVENTERFDNLENDINNRIDREVDDLETKIDDLKEQLLGPDFDEWYDDFTEVAEWINKHRKEYQDLSDLVEMVGRKHHDQINELYNLVQAQRQEIEQLRKEMDEIHRKIQDGEICSIYTCDECCNLVHYAMRVLPSVTGIGDGVLVLEDRSYDKHLHEADTPHIFADVVYKGYNKWNEEVRTLVMRYDSKEDVDDQYKDRRCTGIWLDLESHTLFIDKTDDIPYKKTQDED